MKKLNYQIIYQKVKPSKVSKLLTDLKYEKIKTLHNITALKSKLIKLEISPERLVELKIWFYNLILCYYKIKSNLKIRFL